MPTLSPVGGTLISRVLDDANAAALRDAAGSLPAINLSSSELQDLLLIATGGYSPLRGFIGEADYAAVINTGRLADGTPWTVPITLGVDTSSATPGQRAKLLDDDGRLVGAINVRELYHRRLEAEAKGVFGTDDRAHPGVARIATAGQTLVAGDVEVLPEVLPENAGGLEYRPAAVRAEIERRGWKSVVAFQTRNPIHRAHEYLLRTALESADGLLIHPLVGDTKNDDIPADVRIECYRTLIDKYFPAERVILAALPAPMRYAGPKEAIHHALIRQNYGASTFIVGRDHAGVGSYYGTYDAQRIFDGYGLEIANLNFEHSFWCNGVGGFATAKTSPLGPELRVNISGTKLRELLANAEYPPAEIVRPEIAEILIAHYATLQPA
jgi:sulfate adenylyltransferase